MMGRFDSDQGMQSKVFGPPLWVALHAIAFGFPASPSDEQRLSYLNFFESLGHVLPCKFCRMSYGKFVSRGGGAPLTLSTVRDRDSLSRWLYRLHNLVNKRLGKRRVPSYERVRLRYESFRAHTCADSSKPSAPSASSRKSKHHTCDGKKGFRMRARVLILPLKGK